MISPHPTTAQQVAEAARRERLARLAEAHRYPAPIAVIWARFRTGPVARWFELRYRSARTMTSPAAEMPVQAEPAPGFGDTGHL